MNKNKVKRLSPIQKKAWNKVKQEYDVTDAALITFYEQEDSTTFIVYSGGAAFLEITAEHKDD